MASVLVKDQESGVRRTTSNPLLTKEGAKGEVKLFYSDFCLLASDFLYSCPFVAN
jgi:hypothetical protein